MFLRFCSVIFFFISFSSLLISQSHELSVGIHFGINQTEDFYFEGKGWSYSQLSDTSSIRKSYDTEVTTTNHFYSEFGYNISYRNIVRLDNKNFLRLSANGNYSYFRFNQTRDVIRNSTGEVDTIFFEPIETNPESEPCDEYNPLHESIDFPGPFISFLKIQIGLGAEWVIKPFTDKLTIGVGPYISFGLWNKSASHYEHTYRDEIGDQIICGEIIRSDVTYNNTYFRPITLEARASVQYQLIENFHIQLEWQQQINNMFRTVVSVAPTFNANFYPKRVALKLVYRIDKKEKNEDLNLSVGF